ncbi:glycosyltransferase family 4 protein [Orrella daihaiensis]|uniref:glycosyltransferase family 4 protein n=1 Tax=Orrella daihaiensis TaxID=2782176 RepID=UPI001FB29A2F|nr:glycosyltransferase family 4 protein [Orrella daihaiensis]
MNKHIGSNLPSAQHAKLLYFIGVDWFFYSHFLDRAIAAKQAGYDVVVVTRVTSKLDREPDRLSKHGIRLIPIHIDRRSMHPLRLVRNLRDFVRILKQEKPDIVHQIALKPILIGSIAARWVGIRCVINAVVGLGFAFSSETRAAKVARLFMSLLFHLVLDKQHAKTVFENADDRDYFLRQGWIRESGAVLIRGAGVDVDRFRPRPVLPEIEDTFSNQGLAKPIPVVMLLSRMLWDKGVGEFVEAARRLTRQYGRQYAQFVLVGDPDDDNRGAIAREQLLDWQQEGVVQWWGFRPDVQPVLSKATISCLPSYREGLPKSLLESLAMGLPCVATDVPGCREAVQEGVNGFLVPPRDASALANAIDRLLQDPALCQQFGDASRKMAVQEFSRDIVNQQTLELYASALQADVS